jgi:alanine dehydrogenase
MWSWENDFSRRPWVTIGTGTVGERHGGIALQRYDLVIIGGGAAGINALKTAVTVTARVALVDRGPLGGTCINRG